MGHRSRDTTGTGWATHRAALLVGALLTTAGCQLVMGSRGENPQKGDPDPIQGMTCGAAQCSGGQVCCNASCGICAAADSLCIQIACDPDNDDLTCADLSCGAATTCMQTPAGAQCVPASEDPCVRARCAAGESCRVVGGAAQCEGPGGASDAGPSRDAGSSGDAGRTDAGSDAGTSDAGGSVDGSAGLDTGTPIDTGTPVDTGASDTGSNPGDATPPADTGAPDAPLTCATVKCQAGSYCDDSTGAPRCIKLPTCDDKTCPPGKHCEMAELVCVTGPCPQTPICVDDPPPVDPCKEVKCKPGTHCEAVSICADSGGIVPPYPCEATAVCVSDGPAGSCGVNTCGPGTFCCNASCGICASKKGACLDVICDPGPVTQSQ